MRFREADRMLKGDGWYVSDISGSHYQYKHPTKPGKVSVPNHPGDIPKSIVKSILNQLNLTHKFMWISYCFYAILKKKR